MEEYMKILQKAWVQYLVCALARDAGSRFPNINKMSRNLGTGVEQMHAFNGGVQMGAVNPFAALGAQLPVQQAVVPVEQPKPKDDARLTRVETKMHEQNLKIDAILKAVTTVVTP